MHGNGRRSVPVAGLHYGRWVLPPITARTRHGDLPGQREISGRYCSLYGSNAEDQLELNLPNDEGPGECDPTEQCETGRRVLPPITARTRHGDPSDQREISGK